MTTYDKVTLLGEKKYDLKVRFKNESILMRVLGIILFFNPDFMTNYTTTIGNTVYFPSKEWLESRKTSAAAVLAHELVHIQDSKEAGLIVFSYTYLVPQIFALLSLFAIFSSWWWLLCLVFLAPIPAPFRTYWELRGYAMSDAVRYKSTEKFTDIDWMAGQFTSGSYFFMWPFKADIKKRILRNRELIKQGKLSQKIDYCDEIIDCF